jgi:hypothetical protein
MDAEFWARVERARQMTPAERVREGFRLREVWLEQLLREVKAAFPNATHEEAVQMRRDRLHSMQRRRSAEKSRILDLLHVENAGKWPR